jgi:hypothetical protein
MINKENYNKVKEGLNNDNVRLIAVSKRKPIEDILALYELGHRDFGENRVQEMIEKAPLLPDDICWHFIGHLQSNKVKYIAPFVHMIHSVDKLKLLKEIDKQALRSGRRIKCLFQYHIADEENKFGFIHDEVIQLIDSEEFSKMNNIEVSGLMGMATNTDDENKIRTEFNSLFVSFKDLKNNYINSQSFNIVSMGMSGDFDLAVEEGSNMVRIGSLIFGERN